MQHPELNKHCIETTSPLLMLWRYVLVKNTFRDSGKRGRISWYSCVPQYTTWEQAVYIN